MKNRIKKYLRNIPNFDDLIKSIEDEAKKILDNRKSDLYVSMAGKTPVKPDDRLEINPDGLDIIDITSFRKFCDFLKEREADFNNDDIKTLMDFMPSLMRIKKHGIALTPLHHALFYAERIGTIPVDRYITRHHQKKENDKANAVESIELAESLIKEFLTIQDEEIKPLVIKDLLQGLSYLEGKRDGVEFEEMSFDEGRIKEYKESLELCRRYGIDTALIDRAFDLWDKHFTEVKPKIDEAMKEKEK